MSEKKTITQKVICRGGLISTQNHLELSDGYPGSAITLLNYEPSLYGGYRKINGYQYLEPNYPSVDNANAEGKILGIAIIGNDIIVARKLKSGATYNYYYWTNGGNWTPYTTGLTLSTVGIDKIRWDTFNYDSHESIAFVDGVNNLVVYDGTTWTEIDPTSQNQALEAPKYVTDFKNHIFAAGDDSYPHILSHSAPNDALDWTSASGGGQLNAGFNIVQIKPFRDELYVFGEKKIKKVVVDSTLNFILQDVTVDIGCIASDSVVEINGDLVFLAQDGFRPIAGTARIGDIELASISKNIQRDILTMIQGALLSEVSSVTIRGKSQIRFFFNSPSISANETSGFLGGLVLDNGSLNWEWTRIRGLRAPVVTSGYINNIEYVVYGDYDGNVYRQEVGNSFNGGNILSTYSTPYLDFGDTEIRKTMRTLNVFLRPEGDTMISVKLQYDWGLKDIINPSSYVLEDINNSSIYGISLYGTGAYVGQTIPILKTNIQGSGFSVRAIFTTDDTNPSHSIQGIVFECSPNDRK